MADFLTEKIKREFRHVYPYLSDGMVTDVLLNPDGKLWICRADGTKTLDKKTFTTAQSMQLLGSIAAYAHMDLTEDNPLLQTALPWGQRFQGVIPPVVSAPSFAVRNHAARSFTLDEYVSDGRVTLETAEYLRSCLTGNPPLNVVVSGGTGSGKTTFTRALLDELSRLCPEQRICVMEDTKELHLNSEDVVEELTTKNINMRELLAMNLRMRPDRLIMGEVRGAEAYDLLKSWNTGHPGGICTLHANSALGALSRLESMILEATDQSILYIRSLIAQVAQVVVQMERISGRGPTLVEVMTVDGLDINSRYVTRSLYRSTNTGGPHEQKQTCETRL